MKIITTPNEILFKKSKKVKKFDRKLQLLIDEMFETMDENLGVGLAAPQIGLNIQLFVAKYQGKKYVIINPEIIKYSKTKLLDAEGCLSIPYATVNKERYYSMTIKYQNRFGQILTIRPKGYLARVFQHEIDHLNGKLINEN